MPALADKANGVYVSHVVRSASGLLGLTLEPGAGVGVWEATGKLIADFPDGMGIGFADTGAEACCCLPHFFVTGFLGSAATCADGFPAVGRPRAPREEVS